MNMLPSILFVHGLATSGARTWDENGWLDLVQDANRESIVTDLPGHGALSLIHISEPTRLLSISYAVFCLKKKSHQCLTQRVNIANIQATLLTPPP